MTHDPLFDLAARDWLSDGPSRVPDRVVRSVLLAVETTPQTRGLRARWREPRMLTFAAAAVAAVIVAAVAIGPSPFARRADAPGAPTLPPTTCPLPLATGSIATIAGTGVPGSDGDGGPATAAAIRPGLGLAVDANGDVYLSESETPSIRRIGTDGVITTVASEATGARLGTPIGLAFDADGVLYVSDLEYSRIWRIDDDGSTNAVVGTGIQGSSGNDGPALAAMVQPGGLAIGPDGDFYFDDLNNYRRVDKDGVIHAFAGSTTPGYAGDGGPALAAAFGESVMGVAADGAGSVYLGDPSNRRIRRVDPEGVITTIAGDGTAGPKEDGVPAVDSPLTSSPFGIAVGDDGAVFFTEWQTNSVRRIDPEGIITTIAGGRFGDPGDCGPATEASLSHPEGIAVHDGVLYVSDAGNHRIRVIIL
jgi:sugar lactone lactonase YvrE